MVFSGEIAKFLRTAFFSHYFKSDPHLPKNSILFISFDESSLCMMKSAFYFMLKALFVLEIFTFFVLTFFYRKWSLKKAMVIFKIYDITEWTTNNYNTHIVHYLKKQWKADNDIWSANGI